jgi:hypothetical protein
MADRSVIRAVIEGAEQCVALGRKVRASAPVLALCRELIAAGHDPNRPLHVYRGDTLALKIRTIGEGAQYTVGDSKLGTPTIRRWRVDARRDVGGPLVRQNVLGLPKAA